MGTSLSSPLGKELRYWRLQARHTQTSAAEMLVARTQSSWSQSKIQKIESGATKTVDPDDLEALLDLYEVPAASAADVRRLAATPLPDKARHAARSAAGLPKWFQRQAQLRPQACVIKVVSVERPNGLLQCAAYVRLQYQLKDEPNAEAKVQQRLEQQELVLGQESVRLIFIVSESALRRTLGDRAVLVLQLKHLLELSKRPNVSILVVPFDARLYSMAYEFEICQFDSRVGEPDHVYTEQVDMAEYHRNEADVRAFQRRWDDYLRATLDEYQSREFIANRIAEELSKSLGTS